MAAHPNNARRQSFVQYVRSSVVELQKSVVVAQTARDDTKATSWGRLVHCSTALGYALAICGVDMVVVTWLSAWEWVRRDDNTGALLGVNNDALAILVGGVTASAYALITYCNIAKSRERPGGRTGPRYARWVLVVGVVMVPAGYGWLWALEHEAGINAWYSLAHPPTMLVWIVAFLIMELGGRKKWAKRDRRKGQAGGAAGASSDDGLQHDGSDAARNNTATSRPGGAATAAQSSSFIADTIVSMVVILATMSVLNLCKY